jgi:peptide/nickel transport system substrate-binding protein
MTEERMALAELVQKEPETAKRLLAAAGYADGFSVTLDCPNNSNITNDEAICRAIAAQLREVGITVTANPQPKAVAWAKFDNRETDFWFDTWAVTDSEQIFQYEYLTGGIQNAAGYSNPNVDQLINKLSREMITYARDALIEEVWKTVLGDIVNIPLHHQVVVWAMRDNVDVPVFPFNYPLFRQARFKQPKAN